jgi:NADH:ubiquinone oxidoreductase subunit 4 (subunit M)
MKRIVFKPIGLGAAAGMLLAGFFGMRHAAVRLLLCMILLGAVSLGAQEALRRTVGRLTAPKQVRANAWISALLTAIYMFQVVIKAWFPARDVPAIEAGSAHEAGPMMTVPILILAALCILMGLFPNGLLSIIREAVML